MNPEQFAKRFYVIADKVDENINAAITKIALAIDREVVYATPFDTGRARGNWLASIGVPIVSPEMNTYDKQGDSAINRAEQEWKPRKLGQTIYLCNNVPYIRRLNGTSPGYEGIAHSPQAPAYFVQQSVANGVASVRGQIRILPK